MKRLKNEKLFLEQQYSLLKEKNSILEMKIEQLVRESQL